VGDLQPHSYATPPLFYFLLRWWAALRGASDSALREIPNLCGTLLCALPMLTTTLAPRLGDRIVRLFWTWLLVFCSPLLFYSTRLKQYPLEAAASFVLLATCFHALDSRSGRTWALFFVIGLGLVLFLHTPVLTWGAAAGACLTLAPRVRQRLGVALGFLLVALSAGLAYIGYMTPGRLTTSLHGDMNIWFELRHRWIHGPDEAFEASKHWLGQVLNLTPDWYLVALIALAVWWHRGPQPRRYKLAMMAFAALPILAIILASTARLYPYGETRLLLFLTPAIFLLLANGLRELVRSGRAGSAVATLFLVLFAWNGTVGDTYNRTFMKIADLRPLIDFVSRNHRQGEPIYSQESYSSVLIHYDPLLRGDLRPYDGASGPGWYVRTGAGPPGLTLDVDGVRATRSPGLSARP
jgi:uncharacterized membrane protein